MLSFSLAACGNTSPEAHLKSARDYLGKDDYRAAVLELKSVLQEQPASREARVVLGQAYLRAGDYPNAEG